VEGNVKSIQNDGSLYRGIRCGNERILEDLEEKEGELSQF